MWVVTDGEKPLTHNTEFIDKRQTNSFRSCLGKVLHLTRDNFTESLQRHLYQPEQWPTCLKMGRSLTAVNVRTGQNGSGWKPQHSFILVF